jgi:dTDP-4-dehydrorhamnose reductase
MGVGWEMVRRVEDRKGHDLRYSVDITKIADELGYAPLAQAAVALTGDDPAKVLRTTTAAFNRPAPRPAWSVLGHDSWAASGLGPLPRWDEALTRAMAARGGH